MTTRSWQKFYPKGVPFEINPDEYTSIVELFEKSCAKFRGKPAFTNMGAVMSYGELDRLSSDFAAYLQKIVGLKKGDRIALQMPNLLQYPVCLVGALKAGLVVVNTNPLYTAREMEHQFNDSGAKAVVILSNFAKTLQEVLPKTKIETVIVTDVGDLLGFPKSLIVNFVLKNVKKAVPEFSIPSHVSFRQTLAIGSTLKLDRVEVKSEDICCLQYTGGTTGVSKGAALTHRNLISNMLQICAWMSGTLEEGKEITITALPMYHIFSLTVNCMSFLRFGGMNVLITNPKDIKAFVKELSKYKFTVVTGVNTLFNALLHDPDFQKLDFSSLKATVGGGMAVQGAVADKWKQVTGTPLVEGYGLTESSPLLCCNPLDGHERVGFIGIPVSSTDIRIVDDDGKDVPNGQPGEIWGKGPQVMQGYWQRQDETDKVLTKDGWLKTGDIGVLGDDGFIKIVDRKKDMILVSGFNVYPNEVEDVVARHPKVLEVAAIGVPDEKSGETVKIFVVKKDETLTVEELKSFCKANLTGYKCPRQFEFRTELPKSNVGKILRRALKDPPAASAKA